ncbi:hypothetical protein KR200_006481, partial [Drosophila serrata]
ILYAAPVWAEAAETKSYMRGVEATYRLCTVRVASAFRTVSDDAVLLIAGIVPLIYWRERGMDRAEARAGGLLLSRHSCFRSYLKRFGHHDEDGCPECGSGIVKDTHQVVFVCRRFDEEKAALEEVAGAEIRVDTLVPLMVKTPRIWEAKAVFSAEVLKTLRVLERGRRELM